jgi:hypothetical protein
MTTTTPDYYKDIPAVATKDDLVETLRISRSSIEKLVRDNKLVASYEGHKPLFLKKNVIAYLESLPTERPGN